MYQACIISVGIVGEALGDEGMYVGNIQLNMSCFVDMRSANAVTILQ